MHAAVHNPRDTLSVQQFDFKEVHLKMPSEHTVSHKIYPIELQFMGVPDLGKSLVRPHHFQDKNV
jgi:carbonic anhydrase